MNYYIHYYYTNYLRYGIEESGDNIKHFDIAKFLHQQHNDFKSKIEQVKRKELDKNYIEKYETLYAQILAPSSSNNSIAQEGNKVLFKMLEQEYENIDKVLIKEGGQVNLSPEQKADQAKKRAIIKKQEVLNKIKLQETATNHRIDTIENSLSTIYAYARQYMSSARDGLSYQEIKRAVTDIEKEIKNISMNAKNFSVDLRQKSSIQAAFKPCLEYLAEIEGNKKIISHNTSLITMINNLIELMSSPTVSAIACDIGEYTALIAAAAMQEEASNIVNNNLMQTVQSIKSDVLIADTREKSNTNQKLYDFANLFNIKETDFEIVTTQKRDNNGSQTKIDIKLNDSNNDVGISVKNYNLSNNSYISLVGDTPFVSLLSEEPEFAAHYLNIVNAHDYTLGGKKGKGKEYVGGSSFSSYRSKANEVLKMYSLLPALKGYSDRQNVDYVLINDNSRSDINSVKLIHIYDIIREIVNNRNITNNISMKVGGKSIGQLGISQIWKNEWQGDRNLPDMASSKQRIVKLLADVHKTNISISISPDVMSTLMYGVSRWAK